MSVQTRTRFSPLRNTKEDTLKNVGNQTVLVSMDFHCMDKKTPQTFLKISSFTFHRRKNATESWNDMRIKFCENDPFKCEFSPNVWK